MMYVVFYQSGRSVPQIAVFERTTGSKTWVTPAEDEIIPPDCRPSKRRIDKSEVYVMTTKLPEAVAACKAIEAIVEEKDMDACGHSDVRRVGHPVGGAGPDCVRAVERAVKQAHEDEIERLVRILQAN